MTGKVFTATLERAAESSAFGRARPPVRVTVRGHAWRTTPGVYGGIAYIGLNKDVRAATGMDTGDRIRATMELDTEPRDVEVPRDLREALDADEKAKVAFEKLSFTHTREYVEWTESAKRPETRARRIAATVERVVAGEAPP